MRVLTPRYTKHQTHTHTHTHSHAHIHAIHYQAFHNASRKAVEAERKLKDAQHILGCRERIEDLAKQIHWAGVAEVEKVWAW